MTFRWEHIRLNRSHQWEHSRFCAFFVLSASLSRYNLLVHTVLSQRLGARTCSVERGPTVVVGVVQNEHDSWSGFFQRWRMLCCDRSGCSGTGSCGACSRGGGSSCRGWKCSGGIGLSHSPINGLQDHFRSPVLRLVFCDVVDREGFSSRVWELRDRKCCQDKMLQKSLNTAMF